MFDCSLMRIQSNNQSASGTTVRRQPPIWGYAALAARHFLDGATEDVNKLFSKFEAAIADGNTED